jgi:predicted nuclease of predicted toxin-antitoxin system
MRVLFDKGVPVRLRAALPGHVVTTVYELGWDELGNGALLTRAQTQYDVLLTTDSNIKYQQRLEAFDFALIVLRAFDTKLESYLPLVPEIEAALTTIQPREVVYIYADQRLLLKDQRKGRSK